MNARLINQLTLIHLRMWIICGVALLTGCLGKPPEEVVVYVALDTEFSEPILERFSEETGIVVRAKYDVESTKTVGLTNALLAEAKRPRCDVFWNNEILNTLRLERAGLLEKYESPLRTRFPASAYSADGTWHGFAARARVILVNTDVIREEAERPISVLDLADPKWSGKVALAKPLFGTTASHATILFDQWGDANAQEFFQRVRDNVDVLSGNKQVALSVARGQYAWGFTDTDDAIIEVRKGAPVAIVYPDQSDDELGTLFIPNTLSIIRGGPNGDNARRLVDFLLAADVENELAQCPSAQIPLGKDAKPHAQVKSPHEVHAMDVDFSRAAAKWEVAAPFLRDEFMRAGGT